MIQDIYPHKLNNHYNPHVQIEREDIVLCIVNGKILVQERYNRKEGSRISIFICNRYGEIFFACLRIGG